MILFPVPLWLLRHLPEVRCFVFLPDYIVGSAPTALVPDRSRSGVVLRCQGLVGSQRIRLGICILLSKFRFPARNLFSISLFAIVLFLFLWLICLALNFFSLEFCLSYRKTFFSFFNKILIFFLTLYLDFVIILLEGNKIEIHFLIVIPIITQNQNNLHYIFMEVLT